MKRLGLSIYPEKSTLEAIKRYLKDASELGFSRVFSCLLSVNKPAEEIKKESVIISKNKLIQNEFANWMEIPMEKLNVGATFTLVYNAAMMVKNGMGMAVCLKLENNFEDLKFIPFYKAAISKTILAWKPCLKYSVATEKFIKFIEEKRNATNF